MKRLAFPGVVAIFLSGCLTKEVHLYPISDEGMSTHLIRLRASGLEGASGALTGTLPNGVVCHGKWASTVSTSNEIMAHYKSNARNGLATMLTQRRSVVPKINPGQAFLSCSDGTMIDIEFVTGTAKGGYGEARDNKGNVYRVII
ncbi:MAG: Hypothetical protein BHV28_06380 [Candidatus Tokpelaia hoelldobleri]|uniref:Lipoprotein n=1 Tax=Candidatus Tokpelaia hoelldobleri TaxID=1902579 RepID=A0A1U9JU00_9HYPH|nr:MAG: Hypothetical protein BHV28_06380 [Candidatus Tokpelaia hoelldoblerii]